MEVLPPETWPSDGWQIQRGLRFWRFCQGSHDDQYKRFICNQTKQVAHTWNFKTFQNCQLPFFPKRFTLAPEDHEQLKSFILVNSGVTEQERSILRMFDQQWLSSRDLFISRGWRSPFLTTDFFGSLVPIPKGYVCIHVSNAGLGGWDAWNLYGCLKSWNFEVGLDSRNHEGHTFMWYI